MLNSQVIYEATLLKWLPCFLPLLEFYNTTNILVNLFFGPMLNAARGVALQLNNAVLGFVNNFMTAVNPQITKSFASGEHESMFNLVRKSAKFSYYLLLLLVLPILFNTEFLMELWLKDVPAHAVSFVRLFLIFLPLFLPL